MNIVVSTAWKWKMLNFNTPKILFGFRTICKISLHFKNRVHLFFFLFIENLTFNRLHCIAFVFVYVLPFAWHIMSKYKAIILCSCILKQQEPAQLFFVYICSGGGGSDGAAAAATILGRVWNHYVRAWIHMWMCVCVCLCKITNYHLKNICSIENSGKMLQILHVVYWREIYVIFHNVHSDIF